MVRPRRGSARGVRAAAGEADAERRAPRRPERARLEHAGADREADPATGARAHQVVRERAVEPGEPEVEARLERPVGIGACPRRPAGGERASGEGDRCDAARAAAGESST